MNNKEWKQYRVLVIGAGLTGRGFLGRLLHENGCRITFADKNLKLVKKMQEKEAYTVYLGAAKRACTVDGFKAYSTDCADAIKAAKEADYIFVSVGKEKLQDLKEFLERLCGQKEAKEVKIVVCENGLSPKSILRDALKGTAAEACRITQGAVFCTTISEPGEETLAILSEDYSVLPYDSEEKIVLPMEHFVPHANFDLLLKRKIYTYNCLSACIAYLGYQKGYTIYAKAANDREIHAICMRIREHLDKVLCAFFQVSYEEQHAFSERAMQKFCDPAISDTIQKNARDAVRKLSKGERLMGPLRLMREKDEDCPELYQVIAAALHYWEDEECAQYQGMHYTDAIEFFAELNKIDGKDEMLKIIRRYYVSDGLSLA